MTFTLPKLPGDWKWKPLHSVESKFPQYILSATRADRVTLSQLLIISPDDKHSQIVRRFDIAAQILAEEVWEYNPFEEPDVMQEIFEVFKSGGIE